MRQLLNQYSAALLFLSLAGIISLLLWQYRRNRWTLGLVAIGTIALIIGYLYLRTGPSSIVSASALEDQLGNGLPVVVEVYSDF